ncbi:MAG: chromosomal replication initiator protein DnaA [Treponema sp.]|nr:chromosomal replication initiator protein DnaA [Treponema sp.]
METWDYKNFWIEAINQIKNEFISAGKENEFNLWFSIEYISSEKEKINAGVPSVFYRDQMNNREYITLIENKIFELSGIKISVQIQIIEQNSTKSSKKISNKITESEKLIIKQNENSENTVKKHPLLRSEFTFDTFVKCNENAFTYNAGLVISKNPGVIYNPVLIYGGVGVGKTHLMQAIGNAIWKNTNLKVIYITAENFTNEFIQCINSNSMTKFKNKYRNTDALLIDDIQFLEKKDGTQEELFHTFNALADAKKQIVFTCDRPVSELKNLTERLRSRFQMGLNTDIQTPTYETRRAILQKKIEDDYPDKKIPNEVLDLIAQNVETNVRDLVACLIKVIAYMDLVGENLTIEITQNLLRDMFFSPRTENMSIENIIKVVADYYNISYSDLKGQKRNKNIMLPRQIAMYIIRKITEYSTTEIGMEFGGRDHTTVMHSCNKIEKLILEDSTFDSTIQLLIRKVKDSKK